MKKGFLLFFPFLIAQILSFGQEKEYVNLDVPYENQDYCNWDHGCGYYSLQMVLSYYENTIPTDALVNEMTQSLHGKNVCEAPAAYYYNITGYAELKGFESFTSKLTTVNWQETIKQDIRDGFPVICLVHTDIINPYNPWAGALNHWVVIKGFDDDYVYANDPGRSSNFGKNKKVSWQKFQESLSRNEYRVVQIHRPTNMDINNGIQMYAGSASNPGVFELKFYKENLSNTWILNNVQVGNHICQNVYNKQGLGDDWYSFVVDLTNVSAFENEVYDINFSIFDGESFSFTGKDLVYFQDPRSFSDVSDEHWFSKYVYDGVGMGLFKGNKESGNYYFHPENNLTRAEMAKVIVEAGVNLGLYEVNTSTDINGKYNDVAINEWYFPYIQTLRNYGFVQADDYFCPDLLITAAEFSKILCNGLAISEVDRNAKHLNNGLGLMGSKIVIQCDDPTLQPYLNLVNEIVYVETTEEAKHISRLCSGLSKVDNFTVLEDVIYVDGEQKVDRGIMAKILVNTYNYKISSLQKANPIAEILENYTVIGDVFEVTTTPSGSVPSSIQTTEVMASGDSKIFGYDNEYLNGVPLFYSWSVNGGTLLDLYPGSNHKKVSFTAPEVEEPDTLLLYGYAGTTEGKAMENFISIVVLPDVLQAGFEINQGVIFEDCQVEFKDKTIAAGNISSWYWDFGDGSYSSSQNPVHVYDKPGLYDVVLIVSKNSKDQSVATKTIEVEELPTGYTLINGGTIPSTTIWTLDESPYLVLGDFHVRSNRTLTIEKDVEVYFVPNVGMFVGVGSNGSLYADTATFSSVIDNPAPGDWKGILFDDYTSDYDTATGSGSYLIGCTIEYAASAYGTHDYEKGAIATINSNPYIKGCEIKNNKYCGLVTNYSGFVTGNTFSENGFYGASILSPNNLDGDFYDNIYSDNGIDGIRVSGGTISGNNTVKTWKNDGAPYFVDGDITIRSSSCSSTGFSYISTVSIEENTILKFQNEAGITIGYYYNGYGSCDYYGGILQADNVTFTSAQSTPNPGDWGGIYFKSWAKDYDPTDTTGCYLNNCEISYASCVNGLSSENGGAITAHSSNPKISNCTIKGNEYSGILTDYTPIINGNNFSNNGDCGIKVTNPSNINNNIYGNNYNGNTVNGIRVSGGTISGNNTVKIWKKDEAPYFIEGDITIRSSSCSDNGVDYISTLKIENNTELKFQINAGFIIGYYYNGYSSCDYYGGILQAENVTFTSAQSTPNPGDWGGVYFKSWAKDYNPNDTTGCYLVDCEISYASYVNGLSSENGGAITAHSSNPRISNCTIKQNKFSGVLTDYTPLINENTFNSNGDCGIKVTNPSSINNNIYGNTYNNNSLDGIRVLGGHVTSNNTMKTWRNDGAPYYIEGDIIIRSSSCSDNGTSYIGILKIEDNSTLKFNNNSGFTIGYYQNNSGSCDYYGGILQAENVIFTSSQNSPSPGDWGGIYFKSWAKDYNAADTTGCYLVGCEISYASHITGLTPQNGGAVTAHSSNPRISNCTIKQNKFSGVLTDYTPLINGNTFLSNGMSALKVTNPSSIDSNIYNNDYLVNKTNGISVSGGSITSNNTTKYWLKDGAPYFIEGNITIRSSSCSSNGTSYIGTLEIEDETIILFDENTGFTVGYYQNNSGSCDYYGGALQAKEVVFSSAQTEPNPGDWNGIKFTNLTYDATTYLDDCLIQYGGGDADNTNIYISSSYPSISGCAIMHGSLYGAKKTGMDTLDVSYNYWGASSGPYQEVSNPGGDGNAVSDFLDYQPWLASWDEILFPEFKSNYTIAAAPLSVSFENLSVGNPTAYLWDFGDGATSTSANPTHVYSQNGEYTVSLTITRSNKSETCTKTDYIYVVDGDCNYTDLANINEDEEALDAFLFLCDLGYISPQPPNNNGFPENEIYREDLAKLAYFALFDGDVPCVTDNFPCPFIDIDNENWLPYYRYAKALSYLEYRDKNDPTHLDGVSPFNRGVEANFDPMGSIKRKYALKVLLEAFNISPNSSLSDPFPDDPDVYPGCDMYGYIAKAAQIGVIKSGSGELFRPEDFTLRYEAFLMVYRMLNNNSYVEIPDVNQSMAFEESDFFIDIPNVEPANSSIAPGMAMGNFNHYTKTSFTIPGKSTGINFAHAYNSYETTLPDEYFAFRKSTSNDTLYPVLPLGRGWSHSYNLFLNAINDSIILIHWPQSFDFYGVEDGELVAITQGIYDELDWNSSQQTITVTKKNQVKYVFSEIENTSNNAPFMCTEIMDRNGNVTTLEYESGEYEMPRLVSVNDASGRSIIYTYHEGTNLISEISDPLSRTIKFQYNNDDLLYIFTDAKNQNTTYYYGDDAWDNGLLTQIKLPKGNVINNQYEHRKLKSSQLNNQTPTTISIEPNYFSAKGDTPSIISEVARQLAEGSISITHSTYDEDGRIREVNDGVTSLDVSYDTTNQSNPTLPSKIVMDGYLDVDVEYNDKGDPVYISKEANGVKMEQFMTYTSLNDVETITDARGNVTTYEYDENGNVTKTIDALGNEVEMEYTTEGFLSKATNQVGAITEFGYNSYGDNTTVTFPQLENITAVMNYDAAGRLLSSSDFLGNTSHVTYDENDQVLKQVNPLGDSICYAYDANGNMLTVTNQRGKTTSMSYDYNTDMLTQINFGGYKKSFTYNTDGSVNTFKNPNNYTFSYEYDERGRVINDGYATYTYDDSDRLKSVSKDGNTIYYSYDAFSRITDISYDDFAWNTVGYEYDNNNNIVEIIYPGNKSVIYTYDALNRMKTVTDWNGNTTSYDYRPDSKLNYTLYPNGVKTSYEYDDVGRPTGMSTERQNGSVICAYEFELDNLGNHLSESKQEPFAVSPELPIDTIAYTYNDVNRLFTAGETSFGYDNNGNTTSKTDYAFTYDQSNNLLSVANKFNATYEYDGLKNRRSRTKDGVLTRYALNVLGMSSVLMELDEYLNVDNYYVHGVGLISRVKPDGETAYYCYDYRGSTVAITDDTPAANITHKYAYNAFGDLAYKQENDENPFQYVGKYGIMYEDSTLSFMRARYYDNSTGRFLSEDPIWSANLYPYAGNNPISMIDRTGNDGELASDGLTFISLVDGTIGLSSAGFGAGLDAISTFSDITNVGLNGNISYNEKGEKITVKAIGGLIRLANGARMITLKTTGPAGAIVEVLVMAAEDAYWLLDKDKSIYERMRYLDENGSIIWRGSRALDEASRPYFDAMAKKLRSEYFSANKAVEEKVNWFTKTYNDWDRYLRGYYK